MTLKFSMEADLRNVQWGALKHGLSEWRHAVRRANNYAQRGAALLVGLLALHPSLVSADPVSAVDRYPTSRLFAPPTVTSADFAAGVRPLTIDADWSTFATRSTGRTEQLVFDGETVTLTGRWQWQRGAWRFGLDVPAIYQSGGVLDRIIDEFHQLFGLPEGDRPVLPIDAVQIRYEDRQGERFDVRGNDWGLGETHVHVGRALHQSATHASAWRAHVKLPTGSTRRLFGSGTLGLGLEWHGLARSEWRGRALTWFGGAGLQWHDGSDVLPDRIERLATFGHVGARLSFTPALSGVVQLDAHSAYFDSGLDGLESGFALTFGGRWQRAGGDALEFTVYEDIVPRSVPDVAFQLRWQRALRAQ